MFKGVEIMIRNPIRWYRNKRFKKRWEQWKYLNFLWNMEQVSGIPISIYRGTKPGKVTDFIVSCTKCKKRVNDKENMCVCKPMCEW